MKFFFCLMILFSSSFIIAQSNDNAFEKQLDKMVKLYDMDLNQAQQYKDIARIKAKALSRLDVQKKNYNEKKAEIENNYDNSLLSILDERQKKIFLIQKAMIENLQSPASKPDIE